MAYLVWLEKILVQKILSVPEKMRPHKLSPVEKPELANVLPLKPGVSQNI